jgi:AraC family ethanolamine operon transcriptional activator
MEHQDSAKLATAGTVTPSPFVARSVCSDFDQFVESVRDWRLDFRQLGRGPFHSEVLQVGLQEIQLGHARFGSRLHQRGDPPVGMRTFVVPGDDQQEFRWRGHQITSTSLMVFPPGSELESFSPPGFHIYTVSVGEALLEQLVDDLRLPPLDELVGRAEVIDLPRKMIRGLRVRARQVCQALKAHPRWLSDSATQSNLKTELPTQLLLKLAAHCGTGGSLNPAEKGRALRRALAHLSERVHEPIAVGELCRAIAVSERTLRRAFMEAFGMSPMLYLKAVRLSGARRQLRCSDASRERISDIANHWGFWHMGQFAADYRRQFGELPSETLAQR